MVGPKELLDFWWGETCTWGFFPKMSYGMTIEHIELYRSPPKTRVSERYYLQLVRSLEDLLRVLLGRIWGIKSTMQESQMDCISIQSAVRFLW